MQRAFSARIDTVQHLHFWERLKKLGLMSLQRRRERFIVLHMWKICNGIAPNELNIRFEYHPRMGRTAKVPPLRKDCALANQITEMHLLSGAVEEFDGLSNLEEATQRYQR